MVLYRENWVNSFIIPFILNNACFSFKVRPSVCIGTSKQSLRNLKVTNHLLKGDYYSKVISSKKKHSDHIQLFRERLSAKLCTRQSRKVIWDMTNTLFLTTLAAEPTFVAFLWHSKTHFHSPFVANSFKFLWRTENSKPPTMPFVIVASTFSDNLSRNSCILTRGFTSHQSEVCSTIRRLQVFVYFGIEISLGLLNFTRKDW